MSFNRSFFDALDAAGSVDVVVFSDLPPKPSLKNSLSVATFLAALAVLEMAFAGECRRCSESSLSMNLISSK